jgi:hypothetical protein
MLPDSHLEKAGYLNGMSLQGQRITDIGAGEGTDFSIFGNA